VPAAFWNLTDVVELVAGFTRKVPVVLALVPIVLAAKAPKGTRAKAIIKATEEIDL